MTPDEFNHLPDREKAALIAVAQAEWMGQPTPACEHSRSEEASAVVTAWANSICAQSLARPEVEGKQAPSPEERESMRDDSWK